MKTIKEGSYIIHLQYGKGVITAYDRERTSIDFDLHGSKKFVTSLMTVELAEGTPPARPQTKGRRKASVKSTPTRSATGAK